MLPRCDRTPRPGRFGETDQNLPPGRGPSGRRRWIGVRSIPARPEGSSPDEDRSRRGRDRLVVHSGWRIEGLHRLDSLTSGIERDHLGQRDQVDCERVGPAKWREHSGRPGPSQPPANRLRLRRTRRAAHAQAGQSAHGLHSAGRPKAAAQPEPAGTAGRADRPRNHRRRRTAGRKRRRDRRRRTARPRPAGRNGPPAPGPLESVNPTSQRHPDRPGSRGPGHPTSGGALSCSPKRLRSSTGRTDSRRLGGEPSSDDDRISPRHERGEEDELVERGREVDDLSRAASTVTWIPSGRSLPLNVNE